MCVFNICNGFQPWSFNRLQPNTHEVDLELCMVWPWSHIQKRSILQIDVIKCQSHEICSPEPNTQIYGLHLGYAI